MKLLVLKYHFVVQYIIDLASPVVMLSIEPNPRFFDNLFFSLNED